MNELRNCLIRCLMWIEAYENAEKGELNDLEQQKSELFKELKGLMR